MMKQVDSSMVFMISSFRRFLPSVVFRRFDFYRCTQIFLFCRYSCTFQTQIFWLGNKRYDIVDVFFDIMLVKFAQCFLDFRVFHMRKSSVWSGMVAFMMIFDSI